MVKGKQYPSEPLKQQAKTRQWLLGNSIVSAVLSVIVVGLICSQIWIHLEMEDDNGSGGLQGTTEKQTTAEDTTAAVTTGPTTEYVPSDSEILLQQLKQEVESLKYEVFGCNNCTHEAVTDGDGRTTCVDRTFVDDIKYCPCYCGLGYMLSQKECVWYESTSDQDCTEVRSRDPDNHKCGDDVSFGMEVTLETCMIDYCVINNVTQKTLDVEDAGSGSLFLYTVYTNSGAECEIGSLDLPNYADRRQGATDVYELNMECDACMLSAEETFLAIDVRVDGKDGWDVEYIEVGVNGNIERYWGMESVDDYLTVTFIKDD